MRTVPWLAALLLCLCACRERAGSERAAAPPAPAGREGQAGPGRTADARPARRHAALPSSRPVLGELDEAKVRAYLAAALARAHAGRPRPERKLRAPSLKRVGEKLAVALVPELHAGTEPGIWRANDGAAVHVIAFRREAGGWRGAGILELDARHDQTRVSVKVTALAAELKDQGEWNGGGGLDLLLAVRTTYEGYYIEKYHVLEVLADSVEPRLSFQGSETDDSRACGEERAQRLVQVIWRRLPRDEDQPVDFEVSYESQGGPLWSCVDPLPELLEKRKGKPLPRARARPGCDPCDCAPDGKEIYAWSAKHGRWQLCRGGSWDALVARAAEGAAPEETVREIRGRLGRALTFQTGLPRVVSTDEIGALRPGLRAVLLGYCTGEDTARAFYAVPAGLRRTLGLKVGHGSLVDEFCDEDLDCADACPQPSRPTGSAEP